VKNNLLTFNIAGFTFSSPTIKIGLATPIVKPTPQASVLTKITITCTKGKITKTVTAVKPTCPAGYVLKK
jgi:hypothetical protein